MLTAVGIALLVISGILYRLWIQQKALVRVVKEVEEAKCLNRKLAAKAELLSLAERISNLGTWEYFPGSGEMTWSEEVYRIYGVQDIGICPTAELENSLIAAEYREKAGKEKERAITNRTTFAVEYQVVQPSGNRRYVLAQGFYNTGEQKLVGTLQDITHQKEAILKLKINETLLREAEMVSHNGSWEWIEGREFLLWSDEMYNIHGFLPHSVFVSLPWYETLVHEEDRMKFARNFTEALETKKSFQTSYRIVRPSGEVRYVLSKAEYRMIGLNDFAYIGNTQDITELREAQVQLEEKIAELNRSNQELEQFAYVASHDLQEPLRKIQAFGARLKAIMPGEGNPEAADYLDRMYNAAERMRTLINDLLAFSRVTKVHKNFAVVDLDAVFSEVMKGLDYTIEQQQARIHLDAAHSVEGIWSQLCQLFMNLLANSLKFTVPGRTPVINIKAETVQGQELDIEALLPGMQYVKISIHDNGIGFEGEDSGRIFDIFHRLNPRAAYSGTGIGLAICKKITENHSGFICAEGKKGEGAAFSVFLPKKQAKRNQ